MFVCCYFKWVVSQQRFCAWTPSKTHRHAPTANTHSRVRAEDQSVFLANGPENYEDTAALALCSSLTHRWSLSKCVCVFECLSLRGTVTVLWGHFERGCLRVNSSMEVWWKLKIHYVTNCKWTPSCTVNMLLICFSWKGGNPYSAVD